MYSLAQQKKWLEALYVRSDDDIPADRAFFEQEYEAAKDFARAAQGKNGAELLTAMLPGFERILNGEDSRHSTPSERTFEVTRTLFLMSIAASEVVGTEIPPPSR